MQPSSPASSPTSLSPRWRTLLLWVFILGLASIFLYLALRDINWTEFLDTFRTARYELLIFSFVFASFSYFVRSQRWHVLLNTEKKVSRVDVFWATMIGYMGNSFLPARAGELMRSAVLGKRSQLGMGFVLATALTERVVDVAALLIASAISLALISGVPAEITQAMRGVAVLGGIGFAALLLSPHFERPLRGLLARLPLLPEKFKISLDTFLQRFLQGMRTLQHPMRAAAFTLFTVVIWLIDGLLAMFSALVFSLGLQLPQAMLLLASMGLSSAIPSTPGYVGVYQFVAVSILPLFGFTESQALAYIILLQLMNYLVVTFWGLLSLWRMRADVPGLTSSTQ